MKTKYFLIIAIIPFVLMGFIVKNQSYPSIKITGIVSEPINEISFYSGTNYIIVPIINGSFTANLPMSESEAMYGVALKFDRAYFYAKAGEKIHLSIQGDNLTQALASNIKGEINQYLFQKQKKLDEIAVQNISSHRFNTFMDSLTQSLNQEYQNIKNKSKTISKRVLNLEKINIATELVAIALKYKFMTQSAAPLYKGISFDEKNVKSPAYLDLLDSYRWTYSVHSIEKPLAEQLKIQADSVTSLFKNKKTIRSYFLFKALRSHLLMNGLENMDYVSDKFSKGNTVPDYQTIISKMIEERSAIVAGSLVPDFEYEDQFGNKIKLSQFKDNIVFIDVWATWCAPCIQEIPFIKSLEEKCAGKNIKFISISIDENKQKWTDFLKKKEIKGIQLHDPLGLESSFFKSLKIAGLPQFILIDKKRQLITLTAPKPSTPELENMINHLLK